MSTQSGSIIVSVDLELDVHQRSDLTRQRALADVTGRLIHLCSAYETPVTWAVADPAISAATDLIRSGQAPHEIALLGDAAWVSSDDPAGRFTHELTRRVATAKAVGISLTTLALRGVTARQPVDVIRRAGLTAFRRNLDDVVYTAGPTRHGGLREFAVQSLLPITGTWFSRWRQFRKLSQTIDETAQRGETLHIGIDAPAIAATGIQALRQVQRVLKQIRRHVAAGRLTVETIAAATAHINRTQPRNPATSILRAA